MAALKMCSLIFVSEVDRKHYVIRIGLIRKLKKRKFMKKMTRNGFSDAKVVGGASTPTFKLQKDSIVHIEIAGQVEPRKLLEDKGQYLLSVKNSGMWRDFVVGPGQTDDLRLVDLIFRRDSDTGPFLHSAVLNLSNNSDTEVNCEDPSPGRRSLRLHAVDVSTQTELHVAYSEATYMLKPPTGDTLRRNFNLRREVAKVSPSPSGSFSIRLDGVDEETDQVQPNSAQNVNPQGQDVTKIAHDKILSKQSLLKLVQQLAPAEAFCLTLGLGIPDVKKKQEEHQEKNVVTIYYNLLVYWLETMMGNKKAEALDKLLAELKEVRKDLADNLQQEYQDVCKPYPAGPKPCVPADSVFAMDE